ncbi:hypothetical protein NQ318_017263 [Aromia moschata]|uniref:FACT complex subunit SSRP1 n=1 Tax=Aromia moschata TaxID=1265417 RepID=A0AAV8X7R1_9CUCU|nr:hypothetical protein NQ318_017263 [Aromia moschata]
MARCIDLLASKIQKRKKLQSFFSSTYKIDMLERELSMKGWNWGTAKFTGSVLSFDIGHNTAFEIPLNHVSQCTAGKNEITMEFHQNDDAPVSLMEMRFFIPSNELAGDVDPVEAFQQRVMDKASVINVSGDAIAIFREIQCLTPRGRYDIKIFSSFFQLHGKTFDYKIPISTVLRLFILPHKDNRQMFFVVSLDPPIKQGQTRYHFLVLLFNQEDESSIELPFTEEELKEKYEGKLEKELSGPTYEVLGKIMKNIINRKLTGPGAFIGHSGSPAISCSFKAAAGLLYPLERGLYIQIATVNFARSGGSTRSFDFEVELKSGTVHTFSSIEKEEYSKLFDFITTKKLTIKNRGKNHHTKMTLAILMMRRHLIPICKPSKLRHKKEMMVKAMTMKAQTKTLIQIRMKVMLLKNSTVSIAVRQKRMKRVVQTLRKRKKKHKKEKKEKKKTKTVSEKPRKRKEKKEKDDNKPKRATSAFMLWLNENREEIKRDNEGIKVTEIAKKGGEMWRELKDKSEWEAKANKDKERYNKEMAEYKASGGGQDKPKKSKKPSPKKSSTSVPKIDELKIKSKEYIEDTDSSSEDEKPKSEKKASDAEGKSTKKKSDKEEEKGSKRKKESDDEKAKKKE